MKLYRWLLSFYPARFREEYAGPLQQQFLRRLSRSRDSFGDRCKLWLSALRDLAWSIPIELAHELRQDLSHSLRVHARRPFVMTLHHRDSRARHRRRDRRIQRRQRGADQVAAVSRSRPPGRSLGIQQGDSRRRLNFTNGEPAAPIWKMRCRRS